MTFIGRLKQHSAIWRRWNGEARTGGILHSVHFAWEPGNIYRTLPLSTEQIGYLQGRESIVLEVVSTDVAPPVSAPEPPTIEPMSAPAKPGYVNSRPHGKR